LLGLRGKGVADVARDATPLGLAGVVGETQGRPACRSPTLGSGTQSRWDWGDAGTEGKAGPVLIRGVGDRNGPPTLGGDKAGACGESRGVC
jgi:hypothetical protein